MSKVRIGGYVKNFQAISIHIAPLLVQVDKMQAPVVAVYASSLHKQGKSVSSHDESGSAAVTQVSYRGQLCQ